MTAVHQLLPVLSHGDAIGNATLRTRDMLRALGYESEIYAEKVDQRLATRAQTVDNFDSKSLSSHDAVIYRLSIGSRLAGLMASLVTRRVIVFHNITPPHYYKPVSTLVTYWLERGYSDLEMLAPISDLIIADSTFNARVARGAGATRCTVIPPPLDIQRLQPRPSRWTQPPLILFVGRIAPNKRQEVLLKMLVVLREAHGVDARLAVAGSSHDTERYLDALQRLTTDLHLDGAVEMSGESVSDRRLAELYGQASVFVSASQHEGLCVPVLEAMAFSVPVVARAAGATPETVGDAGLLIGGEDPLRYAALVGRVIYDVPLRRRLVTAGHERLAAFAPDRIEAQLAQALRDINVLP